MNTNNIIDENDAIVTGQETDNGQEAAACHQQDDASAAAEQPQAADEVQQLLEKLGVSESIAASARVIVQSLREGSATSESLVRMVVQSLRHDEELKNAETQGYLRGRNEVIDAASKTRDQQGPQPVNFPIYRKTSFWE